MTIDIAPQLMPPQVMTLEDYLNHDDETDTRYELIDGMLVEMAPESPINLTIAMFLAIHFFQQGIPHHCLAIGHEIQVPAQKATARRPDLVVHSDASAAAILQDRIFRLNQPVPRLVIEVVSSSDTNQKSRDRDYVHKRENYAQLGIPEYWIIDPVASIVLILQFINGAYQEQKFVEHQQLASPTFPDLQLTANQVLKAGL